MTLDTVFERFNTLFSEFSYLLWGLFILILLYSLAHAAIFAYHWNKYNLASRLFLVRTYAVYFSGLFLFLLLLFFSTLALLN